MRTEHDNDDYLANTFVDDPFYDGRDDVVAVDGADVGRGLPLFIKIYRNGILMVIFYYSIKEYCNGILIVP